MKLQRLLDLLLEPKSIIRGILRRSPFASFSSKLKWDAISYPAYGYGTYQAALQARALGIGGISVIEFGVAEGDGLLMLEYIAEAVSKELDIKIDVYGFDRGAGLPLPVDYRDLPYLWQPGFFAMDVEKVRKRLRTASLIIGDVCETVPNFIEQERPSPIGFVAFDLDYYSSTMEAFRLFEAGSNFFLPRVFCYFDDCIGSDREIHSQYTGELLAIVEFNGRYSDRKIAKIHGLTYKRPIPSGWNDKMFVFHYFSHSLYENYISPEETGSQSLSRETGVRSGS